MIFDMEPVARDCGKGRAWAWSHEGYGEGPGMDQGRRVEMLTPKTFGEVIRAGNGPGVNGSLPQS